MAGTHGDLFREIGALVVAAHDGQSFDLRHTSEELARCYINLGLPADSIARAIARSMAAVGVSNELIRSSDRPGLGERFAANAPADDEDGDLPGSNGYSDPAVATRSGSVLLPSGVRLAVLS